MYKVRAAALVSLLVAIPLSASVSGTLVANGKKMSLTSGHATLKKNPFDDKKKDVFLIFTDHEIPAGALFDEFELMDLADKGTSGVTVQIDEDKSADSGTLFSPAFKKMTQFSSTGNQKIEITSWTKERIAGKVSVPADDFFDNTFQFDVTFDLPIEVKGAAPALPGVALPAGGGEPGKAYDAYRKVLIAGDKTTLRKMLTSDRVKEMDSPDFEKMFPLIQELAPKKIRITGGSVDGDNATLLVTALDQANTTATVKLHREGGAWKIAQESWKTTSE